MDGIAGPRPCEPRPASCGPQRTRSSKTDVHSTRTHDDPKLCTGNSHDRLAAEATNGFLLEDSA